MNNFKPLVIEGAALAAAHGTAFAQKQKQKVAGTLATECNYNKEYFADKECHHNCGKKGQPARCCTTKKGKAKKDSEDNKSVLSLKRIKSLTKQIKL